LRAAPGAAPRHAFLRFLRLRGSGSRRHFLPLRAHLPRPLAATNAAFGLHGSLAAPPVPAPTLATVRGRGRITRAVAPALSSTLFSFLTILFLRTPLLTFNGIISLSCSVLSVSEPLSSSLLTPPLPTDTLHYTPAMNCAFHPNCAGPTPPHTTPLLPFSFSLYLCPSAFSFSRPLSWRACCVGRGCERIGHG